MCEMKAKLMTGYVLTAYSQDLEERIANLTQDSLTVAEYSDEFHTLSNIVEIDEP